MTDYDEENSDVANDLIKPPSVLGEEDPFSGDATDSESPDIDDELEKVGLHGDEEGVKELGLGKELEDEQ